MLEGALTLEWPDVATLQEQLGTPDGQDRYLMAGLAVGAARRGVVAGPAQVLTFSVPPVLGGAIEVDNLDAMDFVVAASLAGQLHHQVRDLPPGTRISGFEVVGDEGT